MTPKTSTGDKLSGLFKMIPKKWAGRKATGSKGVARPTKRTGKC